MVREIPGSVTVTLIRQRTWLNKGAGNSGKTNPTGAMKGRRAKGEERSLEPSHAVLAGFLIQDHEASKINFAWERYKRGEKEVKQYGREIKMCPMWLHVFR
jgi:hypothetical protein